MAYDCSHGCMSIWPYIMCMSPVPVQSSITTARDVTSLNFYLSEMAFILKAETIHSRCFISEKHTAVDVLDTVAAVICKYTLIFVVCVLTPLANQLTDKKLFCQLFPMKRTWGTLNI